MRSTYRNVYVALDSTKQTPYCVDSICRTERIFVPHWIRRSELMDTPQWMIVRAVLV